MNGDSGASQFSCYGDYDALRVWGIAVNANRLRVDADCGAARGCDQPSLGNAERLLSGLFWIGDERVWEFPRAQAAVGLVAAIGEGFGSDFETGAAKHFEHE